MELTIVVARRSWLEISLWKLGKAGRKKEEQRKEESIQTVELDRRDQVTARTGVLMEGLNLLVDRNFCQ